MLAGNGARTWDTYAARPDAVSRGIADRYAVDLGAMTDNTALTGATTTTNPAGSFATATRSNT